MLVQAWCGEAVEDSTYLFPMEGERARRMGREGGAQGDSHSQKFSSWGTREMVQ